MKNESKSESPLIVGGLKSSSLIGERSAEEILNEAWPEFKVLTNTHKRVLEAMEEYAQQFKAKEDSLPKQWILVKERLPDEDGSYLTVNKTPKYTQVGITQFDVESGFYSSWVTAWMPLPSPPLNQNRG